MARRNAKPVFVCQQCGSQHPKWMGRCPECGEWNSLVEERVAAGGDPEASPRGGLFRLRRAEPLDYSAIESQDESRQTTGIVEFD
ncbi:MAG: DNA repair protein RadA, partial [Blastocatellia bacterium]